MRSGKTWVILFSVILEKNLALLSKITVVSPASENKAGQKIKKADKKSRK
jgi:hypothetical protein